MRVLDGPHTQDWYCVRSRCFAAPDRPERSVRHAETRRAPNGSTVAAAAQRTGEGGTACGAGARRVRIEVVALGPNVRVRPAGRRSVMGPAPPSFSTVNRSRVRAFALAFAAPAALLLIVIGFFWK